MAPMRFWLKISLGLLLALLGPSVAQAHTTVIEPMGSHLPYQRWSDESQVPTPDVTIEVIETSPGNRCPVDQRSTAIGACSIVPEGKVWIAVPERQGSYPRAAFMHEIGHFFDADLMPEWARERFDAIYELGGPWMLPESGQMTAGEWFAEAYAECALKSYVTLDEWNALGVGPIYGSRGIGSRVAHNKACRMIQNL